MKENVEQSKTTCIDYNKRQSINQTLLQKYLNKQLVEAYPSLIKAKKLVQKVTPLIFLCKLAYRAYTFDIEGVISLMSGLSTSE